MSTALTMPPLAEHLPADSFEVASSPDGMPTVTIPAGHLVEVAQVLKDQPALSFTVCVDITAADYFPRTPRYDIVYHLLSPEKLLRLRLRVQADGATPAVPTVSGVWPAANWLEREIMDLFGVAFTAHPDPTPLILPEDWEGHPLRKDYPVQVKLPVRTYEPLQLTEEEFRANVLTDRLRRQR